MGLRFIRSRLRGAVKGLEVKGLVALPHKRLLLCLTKPQALNQYTLGKFLDAQTRTQGLGALQICALASRPCARSPAFPK